MPSKKVFTSNHRYVAIPKSVYSIIKRLANRNFRSFGKQLASLLVEHGYARHSDIEVPKTQKIEQDNGKFSNK